MTPVYNVFYNCIKNNGRNVQEFALEYKDGEYSIDFDRLGKALSEPQTTLMLLCNPHNPIGRIWDRETLARIRISENASIIKSPYQERLFHSRANRMLRRMIQRQQEAIELKTER